MHRWFGVDIADEDRRKNRSKERNDDASAKRKVECLKRDFRRRRIVACKVDEARMEERRKDRYSDCGRGLALG